MTTTKPLHLAAESSHLPEAHLTLNNESLNRNKKINVRHTFAMDNRMRRNPYEISSRSDNVLYQQDSSLQDRPTQSVSKPNNVEIPLVSQSLASNMRAPAYSSYKHGIKSISRSRQMNSSVKVSNSSRKAAFLVSSPQIDTAPDAVFTQTVASSLLRRGQKLVDDLNGASESQMHFQRILLLVPVLIIFALSAPSMIEPMTQNNDWQWTPDRRLDDRQCVMNLFIERQPPDEFNPDYVEPPKRNENSGEKKTSGKFKQPPPKIFEGTHRTVGQMKVITRLIESVANSFRSNTRIQQHLIFTGSRDGGQLAELALKHWPPRGSRRTQLHVISSDHNSVEYDRTKADDLVNDPLEYGFLETIEKRFEGKQDVHVYDRFGEAGIFDEIDDDDANEMEGFSWLSSRRSLRVMEDGDVANMTKFEKAENFANTTVKDKKVHSQPYPELESFISRDDELSHVIPYMHVDGTSMAAQLEILESARPLMNDNTIVAIGVEHSPDMDVYGLIDFFNSAKYKTFFLGSRQIARIDHLCPEVLDDIIRHPSISKPKLTTAGKWLKKLGLLHTENEDDDQMRKYPPFFVAMPRGRLNKEEMTIQHMYDLFGGYDGGGGQVQTANDRKAPGKK